MSKQQTRQEPLEDKTPARVYVDYDIPEELWGNTKTQDFGEIRTISMKLLTPLEEKAAVGKARGDNLRMAYELAEAAIGSVTDSEKRVHRITAHDGTQNMLMAQLHPMIRQLIMQAYSEDAVPPPKAQHAFFKSRRVRV